MNEQQNKLQQKEMTMHERCLALLKDEKGFDIENLRGLKNTLAWVSAMPAELLVIARQKGDDIYVISGETSRSLLIETIELEISKREREQKNPAS